MVPIQSINNLMQNQYQTKNAIIKSVKIEADEVKLFTLRFEDKSRLLFYPGQIIELSLPGYGEAPFAPCYTPDEKVFQICVRSVGRLTKKLHHLKKGDKVGVRGPYGRGYIKIPERRNVLLLAGGLGIIPLRPFILDYLINQEKQKKYKIQVFYGAKCLEDMLFKDEFKKWREKIDVCLTLDKGSRDWQENIGVITELFYCKTLMKNAVAIICGPPAMYKFVLAELEKRNFQAEDIYFSLERRMHCGLGVCQHCAIGPYYVCKDGPIFRYDEIKDIGGVI